jgi:asparagine synthase (glutamine-hydrolysing)
MCGIAGLANPSSSQRAQALLGQMLDLVAHRGPDGQGVASDGPVLLGHRRLSIVDLTEAGAQPMRSEDGDLVITYNGEIYNHPELRAELEQKGCLFRSHSDTEVILHAYAVWGDACVSRFNGMWSFAIWDRKAHRLFCSRDRFGVKPFYYLVQGDQLAFGSEIRQLLLLQDKRQAVRQRVEEFLLTGLTDHTNGTFFAGICKLPAGHNLIWSAAQPRVAIHRYYRLECKSDVAGLDREQAIERYSALLQDAVRLRLRSDVPVGTCLSGGLDSSSVAALAAPMFQQSTGYRFTAITAVSEQADNSEEHFARQVVEAFQLRWCRVRPDYDDLRAGLDAVVQAQEEPFGSASIVMQYAVMQKARAEGIPVLLDGQGGDETLLGYPKYVAAYLAGQWRAGGWRGAASALRSAGRNNQSWSISRMAMYLAGSRWASLRYWHHRHQHGFLRHPPPLPDHLARFSAACFDDFELQRLEIESTNLPALLRYEDKNSMAHSIETRLPFLDYRLVELALSLPGNMKIRDGWSKWLLRKSMGSRLPPTIAWRRDKLGFEAPERTWQSRMVLDMRDAVVRSELLREIADPRPLEKTFQQLPLRSQWRLYSVALWAQAFGIQAWSDDEPAGTLTSGSS